MSMTGFVGDPSLLVLVLGKAAVAPTLYSDLTSPVVVDGITGMLSFSFRTAPGGGSYIVALTDTIDISTIAPFAIGDHLWMCLFDVNPPIAGSPVVGAVDLHLILD